jgi:hypothetical protein
MEKNRALSVIAGTPAEGGSNFYKIAEITTPPSFVQSSIN